MFTLDAVPWARVSLLRGPTAIERLGPDLWVKREDLAGDRYGGNKVRKLEWLLGNALEAGGDVLSIGAIGSHHLLATAIYGAREGIRVHGIVFPQPRTAHAEANARALHAWAERLWPAASPAEIPLVWAKARLALRAFNGFPPVRIPLGGSSVLGATGWVGAGLEIAAQIRAGELPEPARIVRPLGTGGTVAGLWVGLRMAGIRSEVVAVRVVPAVIGNAPSVQLLARKTRWRLRREAGAPPCRLTSLRVVDRQFGEGYGISTEAGAEALRHAAGLGLHLEPTYSAKAFAEVLASPGGGPTLFVATANSRPLAPLLASALPEVPASLQGLLLTAPA
jgi:1-aminocyclopropane-1-carboxylate deaminase/D-cysteine desulfhydrase-like pyridoxal-dependent ACC family enzyme